MTENQTTIEDVRAHPEWLAGYRVGLEIAAQLAFDQQSDDPSPGGWNDACEHIAKRIREGKPE